MVIQSRPGLPANLGGALLFTLAEAQRFLHLEPSCLLLPIIKSGPNLAPFVFLRIPTRSSPFATALLEGLKSRVSSEEAVSGELNCQGVYHTRNTKILPDVSNTEAECEMDCVLSGLCGRYGVTLPSTAIVKVIGLPVPQDISGDLRVLICMKHLGLSLAVGRGRLALLLLWRAGTRPAFSISFRECLSVRQWLLCYHDRILLVVDEWLHRKVICCTFDTWQSRKFGFSHGRREACHFHDVSELINLHTIINRPTKFISERHIHVIVRGCWLLG